MEVDRIVADWAAENRLELINVKRHRFPFKFFYGPRGTSNVQSLFHVTARDREGSVIVGWLRCGGFLVGILSDQVEFFPEATKSNPIVE